MTAHTSLMMQKVPVSMRRPTKGYSGNTVNKGRALSLASLAHEKTGADYDGKEAN